MHSQRDEERYVVRALQDDFGCFLDIGANDGIFASNTMVLIDSGWSGVMVEPACHPFSKLLEHHSDKPQLQLVHAAVGVRRCLVPFWESGLLSTTEAQNYMRWRGQVEFSAPHMIPQITVSDLIDEFPSILDGGKLTMVSIDTEGTSAEIFLHWPWERCKPKVMVVEYDTCLDRIKDNACYLGYEAVYVSEENIVLVEKA